MEKLSRRQIEDLGWLQIYGQFFYHSPATVRGTREGLTVLRDAINAALQHGSATASVSASDGEGYGVEIQRVNTIAALGKPEYIYEREYELGESERRRAHENRAKYQRTETAQQQPTSTETDVNEQRTYGDSEMNKTG